MTIKQEYDQFIKLVQTNRRNAEKFIKGMPTERVMAIIFLSQRSGIPEIPQLVGDFILRFFGNTPAQGMVNLMK